MSLPPSVAKKATLSSTKEISDLGDADLSAILERLPPYDRLIASEVCRRWYELSRKAWLNVTGLDLSPIPGKHFGAIVRQCPNLQSVFALKKSFDLSELSSLSRGSNLVAVKLYDCNFQVKGNYAFNNTFKNIFSENLQHASFHELILHDAVTNDDSAGVLSASFLPASLTHLQLSRLRIEEESIYDRQLVVSSLDHLQNLECFLLCDEDGFIDPDPANMFSICKRLCALKNLRELFVSPASWLFTSEHTFGHLIASLPKLEVLFLNDVNGVSIAEDLAELITKNSVLRILVLAGSFYLPDSSVTPIELPARKRFPHGFGSNPLPPLHVFVGKEAAEKIRFATSSSDAAIIHPINESMSQFLNRKDIALIFKGVWLAEKIKKTAQFGIHSFIY